MFAAIRESYDIAFDENLKLRDYPTLRHVVGFVDGAPAAGRARGGPAPAAPAAAAPVAATDGVLERVLALVAEQTGYPTDMLDPDLDLEADLGIDTVKQAEVFAAIRESYDIERDDNLKLRDYPTLRPRGRVRASERLAAGGGAAVGARGRPRGPRAAPVAAPARSTGWCERVLGAGGRADGLPGRHARSGPRSGSRSGHRHGQAGGGVRGDPRGLRHRARRQPEAARLPDAAPRGRLRARSACRSASARPRRSARGGARGPAADGRARRGCMELVPARDRLPDGHARPGPGSRGGSGHRHGEAGGDVRGDPRVLRDRVRREPEAARLPDAARTWSASSRSACRRRGTVAAPVSDDVRRSTPASGRAVPTRLPAAGSRPRCCARRSTSACRPAWSSARASGSC